MSSINPGASGLAGAISSAAARGANANRTAGDAAQTQFHLTTESLARQASGDVEAGNASSDRDADGRTPYGPDGRPSQNAADDDTGNASPPHGAAGRSTDLSGQAGRTLDLDA